MLYADFTYYKTEYLGSAVTEDEFAVYGRRAQRRLDQITTGKLSFAFPTESSAVTAVKDCLCELVDFMKQVDEYRKNIEEAVGYQKNEKGEMTGKIISSVTSGSESRSYTSGSTEKTVISEAAKDGKVFDAQFYFIVKENLSMQTDANGIFLLFAGMYPGERKVWE